MLQQILTHTPIYVWAILALLVYRGVAASADREMAFGKLLILPAVMPLLALQDISGKFGLGPATLTAWAGGAALAAAVAWKLGTDRISAAKQAGRVLVRGSWMPLTVMVAIFFTKYAAIVMLVMHPQARHDALFAALVCAVFGLFNGIFFGRLVRDVANWLQLRSAQPAGTGQMVAQ